MTRDTYTEQIILLARLYERGWITFNQFKRLRKGVKEEYLCYNEVGRV